VRRLRKTGAVNQDGNVVTIPRLPSVTDADKPPSWNRWSPAEEVQHLLGLSLDRMHEIPVLAGRRPRPLPAGGATQVIRVVSMVAAKVGERQFHSEEAKRFREEFSRRYWESWRGHSEVDSVGGTTGAGLLIGSQAAPSG
jgi:hypothetical protein